MTHQKLTDQPFTGLLWWMKNRERYVVHEATALGAYPRGSHDARARLVHNTACSCGLQ